MLLAEPALLRDPRRRLRGGRAGDGGIHVKLPRNGRKCRRIERRIDTEVTVERGKHDGPFGRPQQSCWIGCVACAALFGVGIGFDGLVGWNCCHGSMGEKHGRE